MIDFHTHVGRDRSIDTVRQHIDAHGGGISVLLPLEPGPSSAAGESDLMSTQAAIEAHEAYPEETVAFCHVDPLSPDATERLHALRDTGVVKGFGEHKVRLPVDHPRNMDIYRLCGEFGWPVLIHMDYTGAFGTNFPVLESVVRSLPDTTFIGHAMAWWTNVSADAFTDPSSPDFSDYPMGPVRRVGMTDRFLSEYPNLYGDLSARSGYLALLRDTDFTRDFLKRHRKRLLWGTDCPCHDGRGNYPNGTFRVCLGEVMLSLLRDSCESEEHFNDITHNNGARLLGLETI